MTKDEALMKLRELLKEDDQEGAHVDADQVLLDLIDDEEITAAFEAIPKWYA